jgi:hypothetical protein
MGYQHNVNHIDCDRFAVKGEHVAVVPGIDHVGFCGRVLKGLREQTDRILIILLVSGEDLYIMRPWHPRMGQLVSCCLGW